MQAGLRRPVPDRKVILTVIPQPLPGDVDHHAAPEDSPALCEEGRKATCHPGGPLRQQHVNLGVTALGDLPAKIARDAAQRGVRTAGHGVRDAEPEPDKAVLQTLAEAGLTTRQSLVLQAARRSPSRKSL
jgi:hypothetical protein